jgi:hypothetical protein
MREHDGKTMDDAKTIERMNMVLGQILLQRTPDAPQIRPDHCVARAHVIRDIDRRLENLTLSVAC